MVICLEQGVDLHMARLMPLPLTVSCFSEIQIGFISLVPAHPDSPRKGPLNVCVCLIILVIQHRLFLCGLFTSVVWLLLLFAAFSRRCSTCGREGREGANVERAMSVVVPTPRVRTCARCRTVIGRFVDVH